MRWLLPLLLILAVACTPAGHDNDGETDLAGNAGDRAVPEPTDTALEHPGDGDDGEVIMVNGRALRPAGDLLQVRDFPSNVLVLPDGEVVTCSLRGTGINVIDGDSFTPLADVELNRTFHGMAATAAGDKLWVSGGHSQKIYEFDVVAGVPTLVDEYEVFGFPIGITLTPNENRLLVTSGYGSSVHIINRLTGNTAKVAPAGVYPYEVVTSNDGSEAYVSNWGGSSVTVINVLTGERLAEIAVGMHPEGMVLSPDGDTLYVANADSDTVSVIDVDTRVETDVYDIYRADEIVAGTPADIAITDDGNQLYVAASGLNAIVVLDAATGDVDGMIPTGYYPTAVALDEGNDVLYVTNGKGGRAMEGGVGVDMSGTLQQIDIPTPAQLADHTQTVTDNLTRTELFWETLEFDSPIPTEPGVPSQQIKRVVFVLKENKTFDQVMSDLPGVVGDPANLVFGEDYTPNTHALARAFTNCDNYYSEANASIQGHMWATMMYSNDYVEKGRVTASHEPLSGVEPAAIGGKSTIFHQLIENDIDFRIYGQVVGTIADVQTLAPYVDFKYGFWNLGISDETKAEEIIREMEAGIWPEFVYLSLPNDHANGSDAGQPTVDYYIGDNDAGLGKLIDYISHSEYWEETAIFITEDDPQSGSDHIDPHRCICLVVSPWAKHGYVSSVLYSMSSIWLTIQRILGLPTMTVYEEHASPMYDAFTTEPDYATYDALPNPIPLEFNPDGLPMAEYSRRQNWHAPDQVRRLGEIIWAVKRPGEPFPYHLSVDSYSLGDEEEDETEEAREYLEVAEALKAYALEHGLWDGSTLPTIRELAEQQ